MDYILREGEKQNLSYPHAYCIQFLQYIVFPGVDFSNHKELHKNKAGKLHLQKTSNKPWNSMVWRWFEIQWFFLGDKLLFFLGGGVFFVGSLRPSSFLNRISIKKWWNKIITASTCVSLVNSLKHVFGGEISHHQNTKSPSKIQDSLRLWEGCQCPPDMGPCADITPLSQSTQKELQKKFAIVVGDGIFDISNS